MPFENIKQQVNTRIAYLGDIIKDRCGVEVPLPRVKYLSRGTNAGCANFMTWTMTFNKVLLIDNTQRFIEDTVAHEYAHIAVDHMHGVQQFNHGKKWRDIMKMFNVNPSVTHDYDVSKLINKARQYMCACDTHIVSAQMARKIQGGEKYGCSACGALIVPAFR